MSHSKGTVLIVEPEPDSRERYEVALARVGFRAVAVADAPTALRIVSRIVPQIVITELALPALDGFHLARRLRRQSKTRDVTVVAVADSLGDNLLRQATESGIDTVLRRPTTVQDFARIVQACVQQQEGRASAQPKVDTSARRDGQLTGDEQLRADADGARDVMVVDLERGLALFEELLARYPDEGLLYFRRGEGYRAAGHRKLAHHDFLAAVERLPDGESRKRARLAAMRTRSHHERRGRKAMVGPAKGDQR